MRADIKSETAKLLISWYHVDLNHITLTLVRFDLTPGMLNFRIFCSSGEIYKISQIKITSIKKVI